VSSSGSLVSRIIIMIAGQGRARRMAGKGGILNASIKLTIAPRASSVYDLIERRIVPRSRWRKEIDATRKRDHDDPAEKL